MKKLIALVPGAIATIALLGCTQQHSTAPTATSDNARAASAPAGSDTNTFGENKDQAAGNASAARDATTSNDSAQSSAAEPKSDTAADSKTPK
jgi:hypothetical protein